MKQKQLEEIQSLRSRLGTANAGHPPSLEYHVMVALCSGEIPKLKPANVVADTARREIIKERYSGRSLNFGDVFASTNGYESEMAQWRDYETKYKVAFARFDKAAQTIMVKAMDSDSDAAAVIEQLHEAAEKSGLKQLKPPVFKRAE